MELGIRNLEGGGGKGKRSNSVYEIVVRSKEGGAIYIYMSVYGDVMQGKRLVAVFEGDRKYFGLCVGVRLWWGLKICGLAAVSLLHCADTGKLVRVASCRRCQAY